MSGGSWDDEPEDDYVVDEQDGDAFAALDFSPPVNDERHDNLEALEEAPDENEVLEDPVFIVTNPAGTVSVSAYFTGPIARVDLDASVVSMTERELAEEIRVIAELAQLKARSVVHAFLLDGMTKMGHDPSEWTSILSRAIDLPSPEQAAASIAEVFAARYEYDEH